MVLLEASTASAKSFWGQIRFSELELILFRFQLRNLWLYSILQSALHGCQTSPDKVRWISIQEDLTTGSDQEWRHVQNRMVREYVCGTAMDMTEIIVWEYFSTRTITHDKERAWNVFGMHVGRCTFDPKLGFWIIYVACRHCLRARWISGYRALTRTVSWTQTKEPFQTRW